MSKKTKLLTLLAAVLAVALGVKACSMKGTGQETVRTVVEKPAKNEPQARITGQTDDLTMLLADENMTRLPKRVSAEPDSDNVQGVRFRRLPGSLREVFCDTNDLQLEAARLNGVGVISSLRSTYHISKPLVKIQSCNAFTLDSLKYSMPFLVPKAAVLLRDIGMDFSDRVRERTGHEARIKVTSLTRSDFTVKRLKRRNRNATENSCHRYGTTFDISYSHFDCLDPRHILNEGDLKNLLAEVLYDMREQGRCYVMWERKQSCFHITVR